MMTRPLIIVCDWIPPAFGAVGQYQLAAAREAARAGRPTTLIGLGAVASSEVEAAEDKHGDGELRIIRLAAKPVQKGNLLLRAIWAIQTNARLARCTIKALRKGDNAEIKVTGSPPFLSYVLIALNAAFLRRSITYRMTDFYPETVIAAGKGRFLKPTAPLFHWLRRRAHKLEVLSECQAQRLLDDGLPRTRIEIVRDGSPVDFSKPFQIPPRPFPDDKVTLLYSGNLGEAHDIETFAEAYRRHVQEGANRVRLWLNATGTKKARLAEFCRQHDLPIHVTPPVPLDELAGVLSAASMHLVSLGQPFWGYVIPSKIYACLESRRPILYIGPRESDVHSLVERAPGSVSIRNGDVEACARFLDGLGAADLLNPAPSDRARCLLESST